METENRSICFKEAGIYGVAEYAKERKIGKGK